MDSVDFYTFFLRATPTPASTPRRMPSNLAPRNANKKPKITLGPRGKQYEPQRVLGRGAFGVAYLVTVRSNTTLCLVMKRYGIHSN